MINRIVKTFLTFLLLFSISACVPVVVVGVGAVAGKDVMASKSAKNPSQNAADSQPAFNENASQTTKQVKPEAKLDEVELTPIQVEPELIVVESKPIEVEPAVEVSPKEQAPLDEPQTSQSNETVASPTLPQEPPKASIESHDVSYLLNKGWTVVAGDQSGDGGSDNVLYFENNGNYHGFDGCRYLKGKYHSDANNQLVIKSLAVSISDAKQCSSQIEVNLLFVNAFRLDNGMIHLMDKDQILLTLSPKEHFDAQSFLIKADFKNKKVKLVKVGKSKRKTKK